MNNFDFHNLLAPTEFETFCTHVLEIRENPIKFTTYRRGRDGGIDIKSTNTQEKIIGQCKLYIPQNERGLINNLKKELLKCKILKLDNYVKHINFNISHNNKICNIIVLDTTIKMLIILFRFDMLMLKKNSLYAIMAKVMYSRNLYR